ncbi:MAG TPA: excinuclease ABC subunit UvrA, partial [Candidatus Binataceae bacterium]|nr:excinuclease ABC subunit UvrA [Candidatus Binataceae bacterium]
MDRIVIKGAREHNLKNIDIEIPRDQLVVITGLSGSGKSSLAFDTIYAEGQRRYVESLSAYARQFLEQMEKPDIDSIEGLSPAISIEQKSSSRNPRSTVATITEIYDYLRLLFARVGRAFCYNCGREISQQSVQQIVDRIRAWPEGTRLHVLAPVVRDRKGEYKKELADLRRAGFVRVKIDGQLMELGEEINLNKNQRHSIDVMVDRLVIRPGIEKRLADSLEVAFKYGEDLLKIERLDGKSDGGEIYFSQRFACVNCGISYPEITPRMFSFNSPHGACTECSGIGSIMYFDPELVVQNEELSIADGAIAPWATMNYMQPVVESLAAHYKFGLDQPWKALPAKTRKALLNGSGDEAIEFGYERGAHRHAYAKPFEGVLAWLDRRYKETESESIREWLEPFMNMRPCPACNGSRLKKESLFVRFNDKSISEVTGMSIKQAVAFFEKPKMSAQETEIGRLILKEVRERLGFLAGVGLGYLTLDRTAGSLSGGEGQRIRLATQIGSSLVGVLYILDEPSIGLHQRDNEQLLATLKRLKELGNSVIVVEHDRDTMLEADHLIDMGPGAGIHGGRVVAQGTPEEVMCNPASLTGKYLSGALEIPVPSRRRTIGTRWLTVRGARENNLRDITVGIPLGVVVCVTGVSGSGKSTLVLDTLHRALAHRLGGSRERAGAFKTIEGVEHLDKVINVDQTPLGRTPRSNPATYTGLFTHIRELFAQLPD